MSGMVSARVPSKSKSTTGQRGVTQERLTTAPPGRRATVKRRVTHPAGFLSGPRLGDRRRASTERNDMALFMDVHTIEGGVAAGDVAGAHQADLAAQAPHGVDYLRYWVDEAAGKIFCLV